MLCILKQLINNEKYDNYNNGFYDCVNASTWWGGGWVGIAHTQKWKISYQSDKRLCILLARIISPTGTELNEQTFQRM